MVFPPNWQEKMIKKNMDIIIANTSSVSISSEYDHPIMNVTSHNMRSTNPVLYYYSTSTTLPAMIFVDRVCRGFITKQRPVSSSCTWWQHIKYIHTTYIWYGTLDQPEINANKKSGTRAYYFLQDLYPGSQYLAQDVHTTAVLCIMLYFRGKVQHL